MDERTDEAMDELCAAISAIIAHDGERWACRCCGCSHKNGESPNEGHKPDCPYPRITRAVAGVGDAAWAGRSRQVDMLRARTEGLVLKIGGGK